MQRKKIQQQHQETSLKEHDKNRRVVNMASISDDGNHRAQQPKEGGDDRG